jgi:hypothetical protein
MTPEQRKRVEAAIEALIGLLDAMDGDPDLEAGCDDEDCDSEPDAPDLVPEYVGDDQRRVLNLCGEWFL